MTLIEQLQGKTLAHLFFFNPAQSISLFIYRVITACPRVQPIDFTQKRVDSSGSALIGRQPPFGALSGDDILFVSSDLMSFSTQDEVEDYSLPLLSPHILTDENI